MNTLPFFQRVMHRDFRSLLQKYPENLGNYMDDWWIAMSSDEQGTKLHQRIIHKFLDLMEEKSYFLKVSKIQFEKPQMEILGWQVGGDGIYIRGVQSCHLFYNYFLLNGFLLPNHNK
jgi:hypothetical protein